MLTQEFVASAARLRRSLLFAVFTVGALSTAIGVNGAMFGLGHALLLAPPAMIREPEQLRRIAFDRMDPLYGPRTTPMAGFPDVLDVAGTRETEAIAAYSSVEVSVGTGASAVDARAMLVTPNYFAVLGTPAEAGVLFANPIAQPDDRVAISERMWDRSFRRSANAIGQRLTVSGGEYVISGVVPDEFRFGQSSPVDLWLQLGHPAVDGLLQPNWRTSRGSYWLSAFGRLRARASTDVSEQRLAQSLLQAGEGLPEQSRLTGVTLTNLSVYSGPQAPAEARVSIWLTGLTTFLLLIASANVANLFALRRVARGPEYAIRAALGASNARLRLSVLMDVGVVLIPATIVGLVVDVLARNVLATLVSTEIPVPRQLFHPASSVAVVANAVVAFAIIASFTLLQARRASSQATLASASKDHAKGGAAARSAMLGVQAGLSLVLVFLASLFAQSLRRVLALDLGVAAEFTMQVTFRFPRDASYGIERERVYRAAADILRGSFGVEDAVLTAQDPFRYGRASAPWTKDRTPRTDGRLTNRHQLYPSGEVPYITVVDAGFFKGTSPASLRGRDFTVDDRAGAPRVAIVNQPLADRLSPGREIINECIYLDHAPSECTRVIGVFAGIWKHSILKRDKMVVYTPMAQTPDSPPGSLIVRTKVNARDAMQEIRARLKELGPGIPPVSVVPIPDLFEWELRPWKLGALIFGALGALSSILAALGIFSAVAFITRVRLKELAIRSALGAQWPDIVRAAAHESLIGVGLGLISGVVLSIVMGRFLGDLLFQTSSRDPWALGQTVAILILASTFGMMPPILRAIRCNPADALRSE